MAFQNLKKWRESTEWEKGKRWYKPTKFFCYEWWQKREKKRKGGKLNHQYFFSENDPWRIKNKAEKTMEKSIFALKKNPYTDPL